MELNQVPIVTLCFFLVKGKSIFSVHLYSLQDCVVCTRLSPCETRVQISYERMSRCRMEVINLEKLPGYIFDSSASKEMHIYALLTKFFTCQLG